jgi:hypothetical protein
MTRFSGWQRLGILITVTWVVAVFGYALWQHVDEQRSYPQNVLSVCLSLGTSTVRCEKLYEDTRQRWQQIPFNWDAPMIVGLSPIPLFWLVGWLLLSVMRWIGRGFSPNSN